MLDYYKTLILDILILDIFICSLGLTLKVTCFLGLFPQNVFTITECLSLVFVATRQTQLKSSFILRLTQRDFYLPWILQWTFMSTLNIVFCCRIIIVCSCLPIAVHTCNGHQGKLWANNLGHFLWGFWNALVADSYVSVMDVSNPPHRARWKTIYCLNLR